DHDILLESLQAADNEPLSFVDTVPGRFDARVAGKSAPAPGSAEMKNFSLDRDVNESLRSLELIANRLARLPGRKTVIWLSTGFPMQVGGTNYWRKIEKVLALLNAADVAIYSVDARGLSATGSAG